MSFILSALKRAERERRMGQPPPLAIQIAAEPAGRGGRSGTGWASAVAGVVLLGLAVGAGVRLWPGAPERPESARRPATPGAVESTAVAAAPPAGGAPPVAAAPAPASGQAAPLPPAPVAAPPRTAAPPAPVAPRPPAPRPLAAEARLAPVPPPRPEPAPEIRTQPSTESGRVPAPAPRTEPVGNLQAETDPSVTPGEDEGVAAPLREPLPPASRKPPEVVARLEPSAAPMPEPPVAEVAEQEPAAARIPWLEELPGEVRRTLPGLSINVHVYNPEPARRFVLIGMRKYREGQRIGEDGPVVERITPEGMVIDYGAGLAQVRSNR